MQAVQARGEAGFFPIENCGSFFVLCFVVRL